MKPSRRRRAFLVRLSLLTGLLSVTGAGIAVFSVAQTGSGPAQQAPASAIAPPAGQLPPPAAPALPPLVPPKVSAPSVILIDAVSGQVLYEKNADVMRPMASTTKIMTAMLLTEHVAEDTLITASKFASETPPSSLYLKPGEKVNGRDLLHAILMRSANDACVAAAEHIAGSVEAFAGMMTERAHQLGAVHTSFVNPHGLPEENHYSTARDLAILSRVAIQDPRIAEAVRTKYYQITRSKNTKDTLLKNHSKFLFKFPGADGIKTGWTRAAGKCYVGSATWNGWQLISVVLKSKDYVEDTRQLMKFGFYHFQRHSVARAGETIGDCPVTSGIAPTVSAVVKTPVQVVTRKGETPQIEKRIQFAPVSAPVVDGQTVGTLEALLGGRVACSAPLIASSSVAMAAAGPAKSRPGPWKSAFTATTIFTMGLVSYRYGKRAAALTKSSRRRRRRLAPRLRDDDYGGTGLG